MKLYLPITVDLYNIYPLRVLNLQQNNVGRGAQITLTAAGAVIVPDSEALYVYAKKPDGTVVYNTCALKDNQIQVDFDEQMTVEPGILQVELQMVDTSGNSITTPIFQVNVQKSNIDYQKIASQDSFQALVTTLAEAQELKKTGLKGDPGEAATIQIGSVTVSDPGSDPEVTNSGTQQDAVLNFVLPRGIQGPTGPKGDPGTANAATVAYDNSTSGAEETNAQDAFDKLYGDIISITENKEATITPMTGLEFTSNTIPVKNGVAYLNIQLSNRTTTAVDMTNGKVIATGFPIPYKKKFQYTEAIPWNNGFTGADAKTTPLRLCINGSGQLCSYYPHTNEKINVGMPLCINMAYPVDE